MTLNGNVYPLDTNLLWRVVDDRNPRYIEEVRMIVYGFLNAR
jgi:hypothetical protein